MSGLEDFFEGIDRRWTLGAPNVVRIHLIGTTALMLQSAFERATKDSDVLETAELTAEIRQELLRLAGPGTDAHRRHRLYVDIVANGIPFLPRQPRWHPVDDLNRRLLRLQVEVLDVVDVVVSKLKRFSAADQSDIDAMIERDLVPHEALVSRFRSAVESFEGDARARELPRYVDNLHRVERDQFGEQPTRIALPPWH